MSIYETFAKYKQMTDDTPAAILTLADVLSANASASDPSAAKEYFTVKQVAEQLSISDASVYQMCYAGTLKYNRFGKGRGSLRIARADLQKLLATYTPAN